MDLTALLHTPELAAFRQEVREFLTANLPGETRRLVAEERMDLPKELQRQWHRILLQKGWVCVSWPKEEGGPGWDEARQYIFERELALADGPRPMIYGVGMLGPTLIKYGTPEQKARHLPRIRNADDFWCQGFSEPNAGSDLASLQTRAVLKGDRYVINGSKMWTSEGAIADRMFGLFRTDSSGKKQQGITFLLVDMKAKGVEVKPIRTIDGASTEINQVFFTDVEVPVEDRLGEEGGGWGLAKYLLSLERFGTAEVSRSLASLKRIRDLACQAGPRGRMIDDPDFARRVAEAEMQLRAVELTELRMLFGSGGDMGAEAALLKLRGTVVQNAILELFHDAAGHAALAYSADDEMRVHRHASPAFYNYRKTMIYGGSNEIQRNIIAKAVLGLT